MLKTIMSVCLVFAVYAISGQILSGEVSVPETLESVTDQAILAELQKDIPYYNYLSNPGEKTRYYKRAYEKVHGTTPEFSAEVTQLIDTPQKVSMPSSPVPLVQTASKGSTSVVGTKPPPSSAVYSMSDEELIQRYGHMAGNKTREEAKEQIRQYRRARGAPEPRKGRLFWGR